MLVLKIEVMTSSINNPGRAGKYRTRLDRWVYISFEESALLSLTIHFLAYLV